MALAGGSFELRSAPGQGTILLATFPIAATASRERAVG
jgi:signal transduction histidine kinase